MYMFAHTYTPQHKNYYAKQCKLAEYMKLNNDSSLCLYQPNESCNHKINALYHYIITLKWYSQSVDIHNIQWRTKEYRQIAHNFIQNWLII